MNLPTLLFFGILGTACAIFKIPEHDACVLTVLLCDDFTKPLTPGDNSTLEMFESIGQLNAVCDELLKFRNCLKKAETFCKNAGLDLGFELLNNRRLAFDLCERGSAHQQVYMMVEGCVNKYSHSAIEFCTDKAVETVGLNFPDGDFESECKYLGTIQHCHIAVVTDQCGSIAGNMLEKLVVFRGERDFMCIGYEEENRKNLEAFNATMDSYVQQYRNTVYQIETEDEAERIDGVKNFKTPPQDASSEFHSQISPIPDENPTETQVISSEERNLENEFEVGDKYASESCDETLNPSLFIEKNYELLTPRPSTPPKSSFHSSRPYELYRPHVGETLEADYNDVSSEDLETKDAEESSHLYAEKLCRILPENISKLVKKIGRYSRVNDMNIADPLDITESKRSEKFSISKTGKDISLGNMIWKAEEPENIATDNKQNQYEEIYVVTPSTIIGPSIWTVSKDADIQNLDENSQILNKEDYDQYFVEVPQDCNSKDSKLEKDFIAKSMNSESSRVGFFELKSDQNDKSPISDKFIDASTNHEVASEEEQFSAKSEMLFSRRTGRKYVGRKKVGRKYLGIKYLG